MEGVEAKHTINAAHPTVLLAPLQLLALGSSVVIQKNQTLQNGNYGSSNWIRGTKRMLTVKASCPLSNRQ